MAALFWLVVLFHATSVLGINKTVVLLRELQLECRCVSAKKTGYYWMKNKNVEGTYLTSFTDSRKSLARGISGLEGDGIADLVIYPTNSNDSGKYECHVEDLTEPNPRYPKCTRTYYVTVVSRPQKLTALNTSVIVREHESHYLRCSATGGFPAPKQIQWFNITEGSTIVHGANQTSYNDGTLESSLLITAPIESQIRGKYRRQYKCAVEQRDLIPILENDLSSRQFYLHQTINVEFHYPPKILAPPTVLDSPDREFAENETVTFRCEASAAFPTDYAWFWSIDGRTIENSRGIGERYSMYRLTLTKDHHSRLLSCTVCVSSGCDAKNYTMRVKS